MEITFLGHQSWLVSEKDTHVLVDPVLGRTFGYCAEAPVHIFPPRTIDLAAMPAPTAAVLSHAHSDHFDLRSLARLPRGLRALVGPLMPDSAVQALGRLGLEVVHPTLGEPITVGELELVLVPAGGDTSAHEIGAVQLLARPAGAAGPSVFFAADAAPSEWLAERIEGGALPAPEVIVVANNGQHELFPAQRNLLPSLFSGTARERFHGVFLLQGLLLDGTPDSVAAIPNIVLCAGGHHFGERGEGPLLFSDNKRLAALARELASGGSVFGAEPGDRFRPTPAGLVEDRVAWISVDRAQTEALQARQRDALERGEPRPLAALRAPFPSPSPERDAAIRRIEAALDRLAPALIVSPLGQRALRTSTYLGGPLGARRILVRLIDPPDARAYAFDFAAARFVLDDTPADQVLDRFPFGLEAHLQDFAGLVDGEIPVWELATQATRSWHFGDSETSLRVFLQHVLDEHASPQAYARLYARVLDAL